MRSVSTSTGCRDGRAGAIRLLCSLRTRVTALVIARRLRTGRVLERRASAKLTLDPRVDGVVQAVGSAISVDIGQTQATKVVVDLVTPKVVSTRDARALIVGPGRAKGSSGQVGIGDGLRKVLKEATRGDGGRRGDGDEAKGGQRGEDGEAHRGKSWKERREEEDEEVKTTRTSRRGCLPRCL